MIEIERIPEQVTRYIPNGIPPAPAADPAHDVRAELGLRAEQPVVGTVATLRPQKAIEVLLRAAALLRESVPDAALLIAGGAEDPAEEEKLRALAAELRLDGAVHFLGPRTDVSDVLAAFDVAAISSDFEGSPLSLLEYMQASKPVVSTRVGGIPDMVEEGVTGLLVEPRDPAALAQALADLLHDRRRAGEMGAAGRERQQQEFSLEAMARRVGELYEELHARKGDSGRG